MPDTSKEWDPEHGKSLLRNFIFHGRVSTEVVYVPHRVPRQAVAELLDKEIKDDIKPEHLENACNAVRFYNLPPSLRVFDGFLTTRASEEPQAFRQLSAIKLHADLGNPGQQQAAQKAYESLVDSPMFEAVTRDAVMSYFHLPREASDRFVSDRLRKLREKKAKDAQDSGSSAAVSETDELLNVFLPGAEEARKYRLRTVAIPQEEPRANVLAQLFLGPSEHSIFADPWSGYALIWESERSSPTRVVKGLRHALTSVKPQGDDPDLDRSWIADARGKACDAIRFFGGELTKEETQMLDEATEASANLFTASES